MRPPSRILSSIFFCLALLLVLLSLPQVSAAPKKAAKASTLPAEFVSPLTHDVSIVTPKNFDTQIEKFRDRFPAALLFYKKQPESRRFIDEVWDPLAKKMKGMAKVAAIDCDEFTSFCTSQGAFAAPKEDAPFDAKLLPPLPQPASWWDLKDTPSVDKLSVSLSRMIPRGRITEISSEPEMLNFVGQQAALPKVMLFTDKKKPSPLFNALSHTFSDRMNFAIISGAKKEEADSSGLFKKFHVKKSPTLIMKKGDLSVSVKGSQTYRGEMNFQSIHEWLNVHSETFVKGGGFLTEKEPEAQNITDIRPWLLHKVPEITKASHHDVCFKKPKGLCAIYLTPRDQLTVEETATLEQLADKFTAEGKPGFHWSWMNLSKETNFAKLFGIDPETNAESLPSLAVFNPHSRLRFSKLPIEQTATEPAMTSFIEKIVAGDGRFTIVKGNRVPAFAVKKKAKPDEL